MYCCQCCYLTSLIPFLCLSFVSVVSNLSHHTLTFACFFYPSIKNAFLNYRSAISFLLIFLHTIHLSAYCLPTYLSTYYLSIQPSIFFSNLPFLILIRTHLTQLHFHFQIHVPLLPPCIHPLLLPTLSSLPS